MVLSQAYKLGKVFIFNWKGFISQTQTKISVHPSCFEYLKTVSNMYKNFVYFKSHQYKTHSCDFSKKTNKFMETHTELFCLLPRLTYFSNIINEDVHIKTQVLSNVKHQTGVVHIMVKIFIIYRNIPDHHCFTTVKFK